MLPENKKKRTISQKARYSSYSFNSVKQQKDSYVFDNFASPTRKSMKRETVYKVIYRVKNRDGQRQNCKVPKPLWQLYYTHKNIVMSTFSIVVCQNSQLVCDKPSHSHAPTSGQLEMWRDKPPSYPTIRPSVDDRREMAPIPDTPQEPQSHPVITKPHRPTIEAEKDTRGWEAYFHSTTHAVHCNFPRNFSML